MGIGRGSGGEARHPGKGRDPGTDVKPHLAKGAVKAGIVAGGSIGGRGSGGKRREAVASAPHVEGGKKPGVDERRMSRRSQGGGEGRKIGRQKGGMKTAQLGDNGLRRKRGREVPDPGVKTGANEARTLVRSIDAKVGGRMGVRVEKQGVEQGHSLESRSNSVVYKGCDKSRCANGRAENTVASEGSSTIAAEHDGSTILR